MTQETALMVAPKVLAIAPEHGRCLGGDVGIPQDNSRGRVGQIKVWSVILLPAWSKSTGPNLGL